MKTSKLFCYGTLKRGKNAEHMMKDCKYLGKAIIEGCLMRNEHRLFPIVVDGSDHVYGELYEVPEVILTRLDRYEGHPDLYKRTPWFCILEGASEVIDCEVYFYQGDVSHLEVIHNGRY